MTEQQIFTEEAPRPLAEMSRQELALDWLDRVAALRDIDHAVATQDTNNAIQEAYEHNRALQSPDLSPDDHLAAYKNFQQTEVMPRLDADPQVAAKNRLLAGMYDEVNADPADNPVLTMLSTMRRAAGDIDHHPEVLDSNITEQFRALWIVKQEL